MRYLGLAALKNEGGPTTFDNQAGERYVYNQYQQGDRPRLCFHQKDDRR